MGGGLQILGGLRLHSQIRAAGWAGRSLVRASGHWAGAEPSPQPCVGLSPQPSPLLSPSDIRAAGLCEAGSAWGQFISTPGKLAQTTEGNTGKGAFQTREGGVLV